MLNRRKQRTPSRFAIDLGAFRTRFYSATDGLLLDQPSIAALDMDHPLGGSSAVSTFGDKAEDLLNNPIDGLKTVHPVQSDANNDLGLKLKMLGYFLDKAKRSGVTNKRPEVSLVLPHHIDEKTSHQLLNTCIAAGVTTVEVHDAALAAYYGAGLDQKGLDKTEPCVLIDFGATGSRLIAVVNGNVIHYQKLSCGGDAIDNAIVAGMLQQFDLQITDDTAQKIKHSVAAATPQSFVQCTRNSCQVNCLSVKTNTPTRFRVSSSTISEMLQPLLAELTNSIRFAFAAIDNTIKDAAYETGIRLCGGGAMLSRMDQLVMSATDLPVEVVNRPLTCSVRGAASKMITEQPPVDLVELT